ncbi:hypothetical protein ABT324_28150 [Saccharopolyspora sp. NPDC000359]|uniref:hypothetical protein n=1 Tax=Saccharopolyspora sp. NPDC000359 TaxID=3154251 RepID=UPI0033205110
MAHHPEDPPDLSSYDTSDPAAYEWLLSDHPWARAERVRRRAATTDAELATTTAVRAWTDRIDALDPTTRPLDPAFTQRMRKLARIMRPLADQRETRVQHAAETPDDVLVQELRSKWEISRRVGDDPDYRYPPHLIGPGAAAYPPPASGFAPPLDER